MPIIFQEQKLYNIGCFGGNFSVKKICPKLFENMIRFLRFAVISLALLLQALHPVALAAEEADNGLGPKTKDNSHIHASVNHLIEAAGSVVLLIACNPRQPSFLTYHISTLAYVTGVIALDMHDHKEMEKIAQEYSIKDLQDEDKLKSMVDPEKQAKAYDVAAQIQDIAAENAKKKAYLKQALAVAKAIAAYLAITENFSTVQPDMTCFGTAESFIGKVPGEILGYVAIAMQAADFLSHSSWKGLATGASALSAILPILSGTSTNAGTRASTYALSALVTSGLGVVDAIFAIKYRDQAEQFRELSKKLKTVSLLQLFNQTVQLMIDQAVAAVPGQASCYTFSKNLLLIEDPSCTCRTKNNCGPEQYNIRTSTTVVHNNKKIILPIPVVIEKGAAYLASMNKQLLAGNIQNALGYAQKLNQLGPGIFKKVDQHNRYFKLDQDLEKGRSAALRVDEALSRVKKTPSTRQFLNSLEKDFFPGHLKHGANLEDQLWLRTMLGKLPAPTASPSMDFSALPETKKNQKAGPSSVDKQADEIDFDQYEIPTSADPVDKMDEQYEVENSNIHLDSSLSLFQIISRRYQNSKIYTSEMQNFNQAVDH